jgi:hypothetical protein
MVATLMLSAVLGAMGVVAFFWSIAQLLPVADTLGWILLQCSGLFAIVAGGAIVHKRRCKAQPAFLIGTAGRR